MSESAYINLVDILEDDITVDKEISRASTDDNTPISKETIACMGLRFMGGEKYKSLADIYGCSKKSTDRVIDRFLRAVDTSNSPMLSIDLLPKTNEEKERLASEWSNVSGSFGITHGHLTPLDGWLCTTEMPSYISNPLDYRIGHYQRYELNIQAMCDANLRIVYFAVAGLGQMNDARDFRRLIGLRRWIEELDEGYYISGDNACPSVIIY